MRTVSIPVIGNGDVREPGDAVELLRQTGCHGVMIGRGATRNPWIFRQIAARLSSENGRLVREPTLDERRALIAEHFRAVIEREEEKFALHKLRIFTNWYSHGLPDGLRLRRQLQKLERPEDVLAAVEAFFEGRSETRSEAVLQPAQAAQRAC